MLNIKKNKLFLVLIIGIFIIILVSTVTFINLNNDQSSKNKQSDFIGYSNLIQKISKIANENPNIAKAPDFERMVSKIKTLEDPKASKDNKHKALYDAATYLVYLYSQTNNHALYQLQIDLNNFIVESFPTDKNNGFKPFCFDPICASPMPKEIANVISEIQSSSLSDSQKQSDILNLKNFSYLNNDTSADSKAGDFLIVANSIRNNPDYVKLGLNIKIADEIVNYVKNVYPKEYAGYNQSPTTTPVK